MSEPLPLPAEQIETAWAAAHAANQAYDDWQWAELRAMGAIAAGDQDVANMEQQRAAAEAAFRGHVDAAAPAMLHPDTPFTSPLSWQEDGSFGEGESWSAPRNVVLSGHGLETLSAADYQALIALLGGMGIRVSQLEAGVVAEPEAIIFGGEVLRGFESLRRFIEPTEDIDTRGKPARVWNILLREAREVSVVAFEDYEQMAQEIQAEELTTVYDGDPRGATSNVRIDVLSLRRTVALWMRDPGARPRLMSTKTVELLRGYVFAEVPELGPLEGTIR
jgi:hypothetical protein